MTLTITQRNEDKQSELLQLRASLGKWQQGTTSIIIKDRNITPQMDLRQYEVTENRGSYIKPLKYNVTVRDVVAKVRTMQQGGYKLVEPQFPELSEFFRNGKPITAQDVFEDGILEIETVKDNRSGLDFLFDAWK